MKARLSRPATADGLFVWVLHRFAEVFEEHAIVRGGVALRLLDCPRSTTDVDYVFVPFRSKNEILASIRGVLSEIEGASIEVRVHSKTIRASVRLDAVAIAIEASVGMECPSMAVATAGLAIAEGQPSRLVRVMGIDRALTHKLAAWNERRLLRDLFDVYYLVARLGAKPELDVLRKRLSKFESRLPVLRKRKSMTLSVFAAELQREVDAVEEGRIADELAPVLPADELAGLVPRLRAAVLRVVELVAAGGFRSA
ncbi:MAG: nucleotidyl transferase AbiEii/AbiGii toxin family protein [Planctomycetota bacterium]